jgi:GntR family transcriptional regulator
VPDRPPARPPKPVYERIADDLRAAILSGRIGSGEQLPSEDRLAKQYGVQKLTVRKSLTLLVAEQLIINRQRVGNFVVESVTVRWDLSSRTTGPSGGPVTVSTAEPDDLVGDRRLGDLLDFRGGDLAVCRTRVRRTGGVPVAIVCDYLPYQITKDTDLMRKDPAVDAVAELAALGYETAPTSRDELCVRNPKPSECAALDVASVHSVNELVRQRMFEPPGVCLLVEHNVYRTGPTIRFVFGQ